MRSAAWITLVVGVAFVRPAAADIKNFDADGKIYTKWLYRNDDSQGVLSYGNPFWPENIGGNNGVGAEFELTLRGRVSKAVSAGVRLKSRFGSTWQDWWENGNLEYAEPNTSGASLGMDHAEYLKLRGYWMRIRMPVEAIRYVHVGSSDLSQFDEWTIGKVRFIDRDNAKGMFVDGALFEDEALQFHLGAIALPKLWVGPNWSTGLGDNNVDEPLWTQDWAYAARLHVDPGADWRFTGIVSMTNDVEVDLTDPDAVGTLAPDCRDATGARIAGCQPDHAVALDDRYRNVVATLQLEGEPSDTLATSFLFAHSASRLNPLHVANGVAENAGVFPLVYKDTGGNFPDDFAWRIRAVADEPFDNGLSLSAEYFYVGQDWTSMFGARREADVLLTDGFHGGGQLPTLNLANEFIDFDEPWFESIIGWHGATGIGKWESGTTTLTLEGTGITYNTNAQDRDVDNVYPTFQHSEGYTDTDLYDYANVQDRGRDLRSVFRENQDRFTVIAVTTGEWKLPMPRWALDWKLKAIFDNDTRIEGRQDDDYDGIIYQARVAVAFPLADWASGTVGAQLDRWFEGNRQGTENLGYKDYDTEKEKVFASLNFDVGGARLGYYIEYLGKRQLREGLDDQLWRVVRSKAAMEVSW